MSISNQPAGKSEAAAERRVKALQLRIGGASFRAIGDALGVSEKTAWQDVQRATKHLAEMELDHAAEYVALEEARLDVAMLAIASQVRMGKIEAVNTWVRISESRRRLRGLDAPTKIAQTNPDGSPAEYAELRAVVLNLLAPYPDLRLALAEQLAQLPEGEADGD